MCVCVSFQSLSLKLSSGCLFSPHHVNQGTVQKPTPQVCHLPKRHMMSAYVWALSAFVFIILLARHRFASASAFFIRLQINFIFNFIRKSLYTSPTLLKTPFASVSLVNHWISDWQSVTLIEVPAPFKFCTLLPSVFFPGNHVFWTSSRVLKKKIQVSLFFWGFSP